MSNSSWDAAIPVVPMDWDELIRWSARIRTLVHDFNNALVPAFAHTDLLRLRLGPDAVLSQLDSLPTQLERARSTAQRAANWAVREGPATPPRWRALEMDFMMTCHQAGVTLNWHDNDQASETCAWDRHAARHTLRALIQNAVDALADTPDGAISVTFETRDAYTSISVVDNGPGCADFTAVARGEVARHGHGHLGLGLPSAATVAAQDHIELRICPAPAGGFLAMLRVPRQTSPEA